MVTRVNQPVDQEPQRAPQGFEHLQECIDNCLACQKTCMDMATHLRDLGGRHNDPARARVVLDCADICQIAANFMMRGSARHADVCGVCALLCQDCAEECARMPEDSHAQQCQEICRKCADSCRRMSSEGAHNADAARQPRH